MLIQDTIFFRPDWRWHNFLKYLTNNLSKHNCFEKDPADKLFKSFFGEKWTKKFINKFLFTLNNEIIH